VQLPAMPAVAILCPTSPAWATPHASAPPVLNYFGALMLRMCRSSASDGQQTGIVFCAT
ncbi:MAG: hypothetical protein RLZ98_3603, partial [Pseudomonadota bacterium]